MPRTTSFTLGEHFEELVQSKVASGRYASASEVIREALRLLEERDSEHDAIVQAIREAEAEGGELTHDEVWVSLQAEFPSVNLRRGDKRKASNR